MKCPKCGGQRTAENCNLCDLFSEGVAFSAVEACRSSNPKLSDALAVHPTQVAEAVADAKHKGVPTRFEADGRPVITSRAHQKAYLRAYGFTNRDGGYGD